MLPSQNTTAGAMTAEMYVLTYISPSEGSSWLADSQLLAVFSTASSFGTHGERVSLLFSLLLGALYWSGFSRETVSTGNVQTHVGGLVRGLTESPR